MGRHIIGYEVRKIEAVLNWFEAEDAKIPDPLAIGLVGYHEGGLLALHTAALTRAFNRPWSAVISTNAIKCGANPFTATYSANSIIWETLSSQPSSLHEH